ncbi:unnamed protein product [Caenorhabditis bovis]|uniref:Uncharacterized protein n=1 Tax=Caenorhabditis bovis TaxID=2654633 RepID=A0A8S1FGD4_9PELO|nr:unnamed protein product [Caenorhabditis bovis]
MMFDVNCDKGYVEFLKEAKILHKKMNDIRLMQENKFARMSGSLISGFENIRVLRILSSLLRETCMLHACEHDNFNMVIQKYRDVVRSVEEEHLKILKSGIDEVGEEAEYEIKMELNSDIAEDQSIGVYASRSKLLRKCW